MFKYYIFSVFHFLFPTFTFTFGEERAVKCEVLLGPVLCKFLHTNRAVAGSWSGMEFHNGLPPP